MNELYIKGYNDALADVRIHLEVLYSKHIDDSLTFSQMKETVDNICKDLKKVAN